MKKILIRFGACLLLFLTTGVIFGLTLYNDTGFTIFGLTGWTAGWTTGGLIGGGVFVIWTIINIILNLTRGGHKKTKPSKSNTNNDVDETDVRRSIGRGWDKKEK